MINNAAKILKPGYSAAIVNPPISERFLWPTTVSNI
jgi:hypothetical protein